MLKLLGNILPGESGEIGSSSVLPRHRALDLDPLLRHREGNGPARPRRHYSGLLAVFALLQQRLSVTGDSVMQLLALVLASSRFAKSHGMAYKS